MFRLIISTIIAGLLTLAVRAQSGNTIIIYNDGETILLPSIQKTLDTMRFENRLRFTSTTNLNEVYSNINTQQGIRGALGYLKNQNYVLTKENEKIFNEVTKRILKHTYFLNIHVSKLNTMIEMQFYLYKTAELSKKDPERKNVSTLPSRDIINPEYYSSFIIDLSKANYNEWIHYELTKMFPESNKMPVAVISNGEIKKKEYFIGIVDTLSLNASYSRDQEVSTDKLNFSWYKKNTLSAGDSSQTKKLKVASGPAFNFMSKDVLNTTIYLTASDGVTISKEDSVQIHVHRRPEIALSKTSLQNYFYTDLFHKKGRNSSSFTVYSSEKILARDKVLVEREERDLILPLKRKLKTVELIMSKVMGTDEWFTDYNRSDSVASYLNLTTHVTHYPKSYRVSVDMPAEQNLKAHYRVSVVSNQLKSNTESLTVTNRAYLPYSVIVTNQIENYNLLAGDSTIFSIDMHNKLRLGLGLTIYSKDPATGGIFANFSLSIPRSLRERAYTISAPAEVMVYGRYITFLPLVLGMYGRWVNANSVTFFNNSGPEVLSKEFLTTGIVLGLDLHPVRKFPVAFSVMIGGQIGSFRFNNAKIQENWTSFSLRYFFSQPSAY